MSYSFKISGIESLSKKLAQMNQNIKNLKPAFDKMAPEIIKKYKENFPARGSVLNSPWKPRKKSYPWPILNKTGKLKNTWNSVSSSRALEIKNPTPYATYHHFGTKFLPIRKLVGVSRSINNIITESITKWIISPFITRF